MKLSSGKIAIIVIALVLLLDQALKIWVKTHLSLETELPVFGNWFLIHFTENPGMAFGMRFGGEWGKLFLSLFRIVLVIFISIQLVKLSRKQPPIGVMAGLALILAGAAGNIIDSMFYGLFFDDSSGKIAAFLPGEGGYASFLHGNVVDMLYFPIINTTLPEWVPFWGGEKFIFFRPIFNIADASITIGVFYLLFFKRRFFLSHKPATINEVEK